MGVSGNKCITFVGIQSETFGFSFVTLLAGPFKRKYKLYVDDSNILIPRTTQFNHKHLKASGFVERAEPVTCTYTSATDATLSPTLRSESSFDEALNGSTIHVPDLGQFSFENHIDLGFNSMDENVVPETTCYSGDDLLHSRLIQIAKIICQKRLFMSFIILKKIHVVMKTTGNLENQTLTVMFSITHQMKKRQAQLIMTMLISDYFQTMRTHTWQF